MSFSASKSSNKSDSKAESVNASNSTSASESTSESGNQAFDQLNETFRPSTGLTSSASTAIGDLLGLNGADANTEGFKKFRDSSGYNFIQDEGINGITGSKAAGGLLNSGSTLRAITGYSSNLADQFLNQYLAQLSGLSDTGIKAGQVISGAGGVSKSTNKSTSNSSSSGSSQSTGQSTGSGTSIGFSKG